MTSLDLAIDKVSRREDAETDLDEENLSVYNEKELEYLDKYLPMVKNAFDVIQKIIMLIYLLGRRAVPDYSQL